jgi:hypothetical protein
MQDPLDTTAPPPRSDASRRRWMWGVGCGCSVCAVLALVTIAALAWIGAVGSEFPDTALVRGEELTTSQNEWIEEHIGLEPGETIEWFYSTGVFDIHAEGQFVTDQRVVSYGEFEQGELVVSACAYADIESIEVEWNEDFLGDTLLTVIPRGDEPDFFLFLSNEYDLDEVVVELIEQRLR